MDHQLGVVDHCRRAAGGRLPVLADPSRPPRIGARAPEVYREIQGNLSVVLENLAQSKLEVARLYATIVDLKDVEKRLTDHLVRVETRLNLLLEGDARVLSHWSSGMADRARRLADRGASDAA